ncbi:MAG TPA: peptidase M23 [Porphyromonadaceae bacterium]|nr:peptidase M23 [Porphyromonadaceae bacterium]
MFFRRYTFLYLLLSFGGFASISAVNTNSKHSPSGKYEKYSLKEVNLEKELELVDAISQKMTEGNMQAGSSVELMVGELYDGSWNTSTIHLNYNNDKGVAEIDCSGFVAPAVGRVTSPFGWRRRRMHNGTDIKVYTGDPIVASFRGKVRIAKYASGYGYLVVLRHSNGLETFYAHLSKILVSVNQEVNAGDCIGLGGSTGRSTGSHLHFEVRYLGKAINPENICNFEDNRLLVEKYAFNPNTKQYSSGGREKLIARVKSSSIRSTASRTKSKSSKTKYSYHVVRQGDTLYSIAKSHGMTAKELASLNGISTRKTLSVGQRLRCI